MGSNSVIYFCTVTLHVCFSCRPFTWFLESGQELVMLAIIGPCLKDQYPIGNNSVVFISIPKFRIFRTVFFIVPWHLLNQHSLILIFFLNCCYKFSVGCNQTRHAYFTAPQYWGRLWWGFQLVVCTCHQLLISSDIKSGVREFYTDIYCIRIHWS